MLIIFCKKYVLLYVSNTKLNLLIIPYWNFVCLLVLVACVQILPFEEISRLEEKGREEGKLYAHMQKVYSVYEYKT